VLLPITLVVVAAAVMDAAGRKGGCMYRFVSSILLGEGGGGERKRDREREKREKRERERERERERDGER